MSYVYVLVWFFLVIRYLMVLKIFHVFCVVTEYGTGKAFTHWFWFHFYSMCFVHALLHFFKILRGRSTFITTELVHGSLALDCNRWWVQMLTSVLGHCLLSKLPSYQIAMFPSCQLPSCQVAKLPSCQVAKLPSCQVAKLPSCQVTKFPSSKVPKFHQSVDHQSSIRLTDRRTQTMTTDDDTHTHRQTGTPVEASPLGMA